MTEDDFYIGIIKDRFSSSPVDRIVISPLMEWDGQKNIWIDIDKIRCQQLFPDRGLIISFINDTNLLESQVIKFKVHKNQKYIPGNSIRHAKYSIDKNHFHVLFELLILDFEGSESDLREAIISGKIIYNHPHNSKCFIALGKNRWLGVLEFTLNNPVRHLVPTDPENWHKLEIRQIDESDRIRPASLDSRVFVDPSRNFGKLVDLDNWQPKVTFIKKLINRLNEYLEKIKSNNNPSLDLYEFGKLIRQKKRDKAILHRLREYDNMKNLQKEDIDCIVELLMIMEPFCSELINIKKATIAKTRLEIETKAEQEISSLRQEKAGLELQIIDLKNETAELYRKAKKEIEQERKKAQEEVEDIRCNAQEKIELEFASMRQEKSDMEKRVMELQKEADELELTIETQHTCMNQTLDEFEKSLNNRLNRLVVEPSSMLAEALANDAFLQLVFGKNKQGLDLKLSTSYPKEIPSFKINKGIIFDTTNLLLTTYKKRLERVDLDEALASWTTAITLAGLMPVFKGSAIRRALTIFTNHLTHGRCFELPLSPEIISVERLFTIGQSSDTSSLGILDTALLYAANHREALFILVLEGLDRAPSQYFVDALLDWYIQGLLDIPGDTFLSQRLKRLRRQDGLADDVINWSSNLLLAATMNGLPDGFPVSSTAMTKIIEVVVEPQGKHLDIHPAILDHNACKPVGEVTTSQWNDWRRKAQDQDVSLMAQLITNLHKSEQQNVGKNETALRIFAALCVLESLHDDAISIVQRYFLKIS